MRGLVFMKALLVLYLLISSLRDMRKDPSLTHCHYSVCVPLLDYQNCFSPIQFVIKTQSLFATSNYSVANFPSSPCFFNLGTWWDHPCLCMACLLFSLSVSDSSVCLRRFLMTWQSNYRFIWHGEEAHPNVHKIQQREAWWFSAHKHNDIVIWIWSDRENLWGKSIWQSMNSCKCHLKLTK